MAADWNGEAIKSFPPQTNSAQAPPVGELTSCVRIMIASAISPICGPFPLGVLFRGSSAFRN